MAAGFLETYTAWSNGEIYGYALERINPSKCDLGFTHETPTDEDSCWGFIGFDNFQDAVQDATYSMDATADNTEIVDKAYGMADYGDFFPTHTMEDHERIEKNTGEPCKYLGCVRMEVPE